MNLMTLTQALRIQIVENYYKYKKEFPNDNVEDDFDDEEDIYDNEIEDEDETTEELYSIYDELILSKIITDIKNSGYKKAIYFIIIKDCLEYIKSKVVKKNFIYSEEKLLLILLENLDTKKLLNIIDKDEEFLLNIITIFLEYNTTYTNEEKYENRSILKKQKSKISKQFKLSILDDIQEYYDKNK